MKWSVKSSLMDFRVLSPLCLPGGQPLPDTAAGCVLCTHWSAFCFGHFLLFGPPSGAGEGVQACSNFLRSLDSPPAIACRMFGLMGI